MDERNPGHPPILVDRPGVPEMAAIRSEYPFVMDDV